MDEMLGQRPLSNVALSDSGVDLGFDGAEDEAGHSGEIDAESTDMGHASTPSHLHEVEDVPSSADTTASQDGFTAPDVDVEPPAPDVEPPNASDPFLPVSSLHLLVPPLQLFSAAMWQVLQQQRLLHYGKLKEFVSLVMEMFPDLLSESQRTELTLGLQHMGPAEIGCKTDPAVETLLWEFLSRLNQLLLVPDLKQTVSWLHAAPSVLEVCVQSDSCIDQLRTLLRPHRSCQQLDKIETLPSLEECKLDYMGLLPSQRVVDSTLLTNSNIQSQSITDCINCLNPTTSGHVIKAESVMDSSDCTGAEPQSSVNRCEDTEDRIQRKTEYLTNRLQKNILINMKEEEEDGESQSLKMIRKDERYKGYRKDEEKHLEGNTTCQAAQTDKLVQNRVHSEQGQQEGDDLFSLVTFCLLKQPKVLIHRIENCSSSVPVSSPPHSMVTPLRGNGLLRLKKDQVLTQKSETISQSERPMKLLPFSPEIRMSAEVSLGSPVISSWEQNTGQTVEEVSQVFACSQCPFIHTEEVNLHQHIEKNHTEQLSWSLGPQKSHSSTHQHLSPPKTLPTPTQSHTGTPGTHTCSQCGKSFAQLGNLKKHQRTHTGERPYPCSHCGKSFVQSCHLKKHLQTHTGERPYPCSQCEMNFINSSNLKAHLRTHMGDRPYSCSHCGRSFTQFGNLEVHLRTHTGERPYSCSQCGRRFTQFGNLEVHLRTHTGERPYSCSQCGRSFSQFGNLEVHLRTHTGERPYSCSHCGKSFAQSCHLKKHLRTHTGEKPCQFSHCGKSFAHFHTLKNHLKTHTGERPYPCSHCGKSFAHFSHLTEHLRTHAGECSYPCSQCEMNFRNSSNLKVHLRTHTGDRPYSCSHCGRSFTQFGNLEVHLRTHTGERPYSCSQCGRSFTQFGNLEVHLRTHTGERPYSCSHCGKSFAQSCHLKKHLRTHKGERPYSAH